MRRAFGTALAWLALAGGAAGCGTSPEDDAREQGEEVGSALAALVDARSAAAATEAARRAQGAFAEVRDELPAGVRSELTAIGDQLEEDLRDASDLSGRRTAFLRARAQLDTLASDTDSVVNEFRRGVREGYEDATDGP